jgi:hypothetical protein
MASAESAESGPSTTSTVTASDFEALFNTALVKYNKCTGQDLCSHPLSAMIDRCQSPDTILELLGGQVVQWSLLVPRQCDESPIEADGPWSGGGTWV